MSTYPSHKKIVVCYCYVNKSLSLYKYESGKLNPFHNLTCKSMKQKLTTLSSVIYCKVINWMSWAKQRTAWKVFVFIVVLVQMWENADQNNSEYEHFLCSGVDSKVGL